MLHGTSEKEEKNRRATKLAQPSQYEPNQAMKSTIDGTRGS